MGAPAAPSRSSNCFISDPASTLLTPALIVLTTFAGVPAGAKSPHQFSYVNPGTPDSAIAGRPGTIGVGLALLTAIARAFPALTCVMTAGELAMMASTSPEMSATTPG